MSRWPHRSLSDVARLVGGSTPTRDNQEYWNGDIPWLSPAELPMPGKGIVRIDGTREKITDKGLNSCAATLLPIGTVVFSSRATIGKIGITNVALATNQGFVSLVPSKEISAEFLAYALLVHIEAIASLAGSTTFKEVSRGNLRDFRIPVPPLAEQERIVRILDEAEALHRLRAQADGRTHDIAPALFDELFGDPARSSNRWPIVPVSQFVRRFQAGRSVAPAGEENSPSKHRILKVSAVTWGRFAPEESKPVADSYEPTSDQFVRTGDMLFSRANTTELVGATVLVEDTPDNLLLSDKLWRFVWDNPDAIEPRFVLSLFQHPSVRLELGNRATGTGGSMKNISMDKVMAMEVPLPPVELQRAFAARVVEIRDLEAAQAASRQRLDDLFESLLHGAFQREL